MIRGYYLGCPAWGVKEWAGTLYLKGARPGNYLGQYAEGEEATSEYPVGVPATRCLQVLLRSLQVDSETHRVPMTPEFKAGMRVSILKLRCRASISNCPNAVLIFTSNRRAERLP